MVSRYRRQLMNNTEATELVLIIYSYYLNAINYYNSSAYC